MCPGASKSVPPSELNGIGSSFLCNGAREGDVLDVGAPHWPLAAGLLYTMYSRPCAMGCETGLCSPRMCVLKSSALSRRLPLVWPRSFALRTCPRGRQDLAPPYRSRVAGLPQRGIRNSRACLNWRKRATFRSDGSCRIGVCHTCMTGLIDGSISYNREPLERPTSGNVLLCCSQPNSGVTLDP